MTLVILYADDSVAV